MPTIILLISPVAPPSNASVTDNSIQTIRNTFVKYCKYTISQIHAHHPSEEICLLYYDDDDHTTAAKNTTTTADAPPTLSTSSLRHDVDNHNNNNNNNDEQLQLIQSYSRETSLLIQSLDSFNDNNNNNNNITMYNSTRDFQQSSLSMPSSVLTQCFHHVENTLGKHSHTQIILITNYQQFDSSLYRIKPTFPAKVHLFSLYQPPTMHNMSMMTMMNNSTTIATATPTTTTTPPLMQQHQQSSSLNNTTTHKMSHNTTSNNNNNNNNNNRIEQLCEMNNGTHMYMYTHYHNHQIQQSLYDQFIVHNYNKYNGYLSYGHLISSIELHPDPNLVQWSSHHSSSSSIVSSSTTSTTNTSSGSSNSGGSSGSGASDASDSHSKSTNESENIIPHVLNIMGFVDAGCMSSAKCISRHNVLPFTPPASSSSSHNNNNSSGNNSRFINTSHLSSPMMMNNVTPATPTTTVAATTTTTSITPSKKKSSVDKSKKIKKKKSKQRGDSSGGDDGSDGGGDDDGGAGEYENRDEEEEATTTSTTPEDEQSDHMNDNENAVDDEDDGDAAVAAEDDAPQKHRKTRVKSKVGTKRTRTHDNTDEASGASDAEDSEMNDSDANNRKTKQKKKKSKSQKKSKSSKSKKKSKANHSDEDGDEDEGNDKKWNNQVMLSALNQCIHGKKLTRKELEYQFGPNAESRKMIKADACKLDHIPSTSFYELLHMSLLNTRTCAIVKLCGDYYGYLGVVHDAEYSGLLLSVLDYQAINAAMTMTTTTTTISGTSVGPTTNHASSANISSEQQHSDALLHQLLQQVSHTPLHHVNQAGNAVHSTIAHSVNNRPNPSATLCYPWLKDSIDHMVHYTSFKSSMEPIIEYSRQQQQDKAKKSKNTSDQQASSVIPSDETLQIEMDLLQQDYHPKLYNYNLKSVKTIVPFVKRETIHADFQKLSRTCAQLPHKMELMYSEIEKIRFTAHVYLNPTLVTSLVQLLSELKTDCVNQLAHLQQSSEDEEDQEVMIENQVLSIIIYETVMLQLNANKPCSSEYEKLSVPDMTVLSSNVERKKRELGLQSLIQPPQQAQPPHQQQQQQPPKQPHPTLHHQQPQPQPQQPQQHMIPPSHHPHPYHHPHSHPQQQQQHPHHQPHHQHYSPNPPPPQQQQQPPPHHHQHHQQPHQPHHHYP